MHVIPDAADLERLYAIFPGNPAEICPQTLAHLFVQARGAILCAEYDVVMQRGVGVRYATWL